VRFWYPTCSRPDPLLPCSFDLLHVMIDETSEGTDSRIAQHIIRLHRFQVNMYASDFCATGLPHLP
jgi:DNA replication licensing factor MCM6